MNTVDAVDLIIAVIAEIAASALVAVESAIGRVSRSRAAQAQEDSLGGARSLMVVAGDPARYINAVLFVRIALSVLAIVLVARVTFDLVGGDVASVVVTTAVMVVVNFVILGVAPRTLGQQRPLGIARRTATFVRFLTALVAPFTRIFILIGNAITPGKGFVEGPFASEAEILELLEGVGDEEVLAADERRMIESVFELGDTICREIMVPRTEMVYLPGHKTLRQAMSLCLRSGFSRIPVVADDLDEVIGVLHMKDIVREIEASRSAELARVSEHMRAPLLMPDTKRAADMLRTFQQNRTHLAVLVDEYGGTAGLVTVEDILEEIVGEMSDEHDQNEVADVVELAPGRWRLSARLSVDDLADFTDLDITSQDERVETVGGLLGRRLGLVPLPGAVVVIDGYRFTAETLEGRRNRIATVLLEDVARTDNGPTQDREVTG